MRKALGAFTLLLGVTLAVWIGYNLFVERQPEARGQSPLPALVLVAGFVYQGQKWLRAPVAAPIVIERRLAIPAERAFDAYVRRMGQWWPASHTRDAASFAGVTIEPEVGGRVHASFRNGRDDDWGKVDTYDPWRHAIGYSFTLAQPADQPPSRIEVVFTNAAGPWSFWKAGTPYGCRSRREEGCADEGLPVWRILYRRRD